MRIELNGYTVTKLIDSRYLVVNPVLLVNCIVDDLDDAIEVINERA